MEPAYRPPEGGPGPRTTYRTPETKTARTRVESAAALWTGIVRGEWLLVDWYDTDERLVVIARRNHAPKPDQALTLRELQVLRHASRGFSNKWIALDLDVACSTVSSDLASAMKKLGAQTRFDVALLRPVFEDLDDSVVTDDGENRDD